MKANTAMLVDVKLVLLVPMHNSILNCCRPMADEERCRRINVQE